MALGPLSFGPLTSPLMRGFRDLTTIDKIVTAQFLIAIEMAKLQENINDKSILLNYGVTRGKNPRFPQNNEFYKKVVRNFPKIPREPHRHGHSHAYKRGKVCFPSRMNLFQSRRVIVR